MQGVRKESLFFLHAEEVCALAVSNRLDTSWTNVHLYKIQQHQIN
jgi:hypothetical protein